MTKQSEKIQKALRIDSENTAALMAASDILESAGELDAALTAATTAVALLEEVRQLYSGNVAMGYDLDDFCSAAHWAALDG